HAACRVRAVGDPHRRPAVHELQVGAGAALIRLLGRIPGERMLEVVVDDQTTFQPRPGSAGSRRPGVAAWRPVTRRDVSTRRYADDALLAEAASFPLGTFPAVPGTAQYRLEFSGKRSAPWWQHATETNTTWTFTFSRPRGRAGAATPAAGGLPPALGELNRLADRAAFTLTLDVRHQPGV